VNAETLHAYLDGELSPAEAALVERALEADPHLAAELRAMRAADEALSLLPGCEAPADLADRVLAAARRPRRLRRWLVQVPFVAAAAAVLVAALLSEHRPPPVDDPFSVDEHLPYVWEADSATFGSLALEDLEDRILEELEAT
jgi:anti-sigma factor RsiW